MQQIRNKYERLLLQPFYIEYVKQVSSFSMPVKHYHEAYEIYYMKSGERKYFIKDKTYYVVKGSMVFINSNDIHKTSDAGSPAYERILINFSKEFLGTMIDMVNDISPGSC